MLKSFAALSCLVAAMAIPATCWGGGVSDAVITRLAIDKRFGDIVFVLVAKAKDTTPSCDINGSWTFVMPLATEQDKKMYAILLAARASQTPISLVGNGACGTFGSIEDLVGVYY